MTQPQQQAIQAKKKKLDSRIPTLITNGVTTNTRSFFVLVGDRGKDQVVTLHYLLSKARVSSRPSVLWCYKKDLGFSSHRKKRMNQIQRQIARGQREVDQEDPFELFVSSTNIRYTYYKESEKILGQTFGMCVLQDFEALTPNLLARTIETVEGGGIVVLLLRTMTSLKQLYTMTMDVHARYRTEAHHDTVARFNERFILSLGGCSSCLVVDDELNILPLSAGKHVKPIPRLEDIELTPSQKELADLKASLKDTEPVSSLLSTTKTLDQARAVLTFIESIADKTLRSTVTLTAARGRGKSASLGIAMAAAIAYGYSNIFITSPSPENLKTLFEFVFKAFDALGYEEHLDYDIVQSTNPDFQKAVVRVNVFRQHRQTIQYIQPTDAAMLSQAELVVIDEAAAIPLPLVKNLLGPYLVFMASTINGYEGTGRSLSLKLISQLRQQSAASITSSTLSSNTTSSSKPSSSAATTAATATPPSLRTLREIVLQEPIRYGTGDAVESWLTQLLCLDACSPEAGLVPRPMKSISGCPHPDTCELYYVNRDTLFSYHPVSETFLQRMMSLYVASHYKNSPNDLQLMSDAPAHHLFVLLPPMTNTSTLPDPLVVLQIALEGSLTTTSTLSSLQKGVRANGDLIPWVMSQQFQDDDFARLDGARIVRVATHPDFIGMGYGARAVKKLEDYYLGKEVGVGEDTVEDEMKRVSDDELLNASLKTDAIKVRDASTMPPLLLKLSERPPKESLHWLGVSYGITHSLHKFWKRAGYIPVYLRQTTNDLTGEHTCIMLKPLDRTEEGSDKKKRKGMSESAVVSTDRGWVQAFSWDFRRRFIELLGYQFKALSPILVLSLLEGSDTKKPEDIASIDSRSELSRYFTPFDLKRLESYTQNLLDYHVILDLVPIIASLYFTFKLHPSESTASTSSATTTPPPKPVHLSPVQSAILLSVGLQRKSLEEVAALVELPVSQVMALFGKVVKKCSLYFEAIETREVGMQVDGDKKKGKARITDANDDDDGEEKDEASGDENGTKKDVDDDEAWDPVAVGLEEDLKEAGDEAVALLKQKQREMVDSLNLGQYAIKVNEDDWKEATANGKAASKSLLQVKNPNSTKKRKYDAAAGTASGLASTVRGDKTGIYDSQAARGKTMKGKKGDRR